MSRIEMSQAQEGDPISIPQNREEALAALIMIVCHSEPDKLASSLSKVAHISLSQQFLTAQEIADTVRGTRNFLERKGQLPTERRILSFKPR